MSGFKFEAVGHANADCSSVRAKNVHPHEERKREILHDDLRMMKHDASYLKQNIDKTTTCSAGAPDSNDLRRPLVNRLQARAITKH